MEQGFPDPVVQERNECVVRALGVDASRLAELGSVLNGDWTQKHRLLHVSPHPCDARRREQLVKHIANCLLETCFSSLPDVPIPSRWSKVSNCSTWWALGFHVHDVLTKVLQLGFNPTFAKCLLPKHIAELVVDPVIPGPHSCKALFVYLFSWQQTGSRCHRCLTQTQTQTLCQDPAT